MVHLPSATIRREGALPERDQGHRLSEDVRHGGAVRPGGAVRVRRVGALAEESRKSHLGSSRRGEAVRRGGGGVLQHRGGGRVLLHRGGGRGVRVRRDQAAAARMPRLSTFFKASRLKTSLCTYI